MLVADKGGTILARQHLLALLLAVGLLITGCRLTPAGNHLRSIPTSGHSHAQTGTSTKSIPIGNRFLPTDIRINLPVVNGTATDNVLRMRQYWEAELGLTTTYDRHELMWRQANRRVYPGQRKFGNPRIVEIGGGSAWAPVWDVGIWYHPVTIIGHDGGRHYWILVTIQEKPGQNEQMADLIPRSTSTLSAKVPATATAVRVVMQYLHAIKGGNWGLALAKALLAPQSRMEPDTALMTSSTVRFRGGTVSNVGKASFDELDFTADSRLSGINDYFFTVSNLNGPWQILSEGSGPSW